MQEDERAVDDQAKAGPNVTGSGFFTRGSHEDEVLRLQGTPNSIEILADSEIWRYGPSTVTISTRSRRVTEWWDPDGDLQARLAPGLDGPRRFAGRLILGTMALSAAAYFGPSMLSNLLESGPTTPEAAEAELALDRPTRRLIQQGLGNEGFSPGTPDGLFGPRTRAAIRAWQGARGAPDTGYLDGRQAEVLRSAASPGRVEPLPLNAQGGRGGLLTGGGDRAAAGTEAAEQGLAQLEVRNVNNADFFTRGSHEDEVLRLQGTPTGISTLSDSEIWWYGLSTVTISKQSRRVTEWSDLGRKLRVRLVPSRVEDGPPRTAEAAPASVLRPGPGIVNPWLLREVRPQYTAEALRAKIVGTVYLEMVVLPDGTVGDVRITKSLDPGLDREAVKAARQWLFEPGTRSGEPVAILVNLALDFHLR